MWIRTLATIISLALLSFALCAAQSEQSPDFRNFSYPWPGAEGVPAKWSWLAFPTSKSVLLVHGKHDFEVKTGDSIGLPYLLFESESHGDLGSTAPRVAVVTLRYGTGGSANWSYLYVYELSESEPRLMGVLRSGSRGDGSLIKATIRDHRLVLDFADAARKTADCCSDGFVRARFKWNGKRFSQIGPSDRGDITNVEK
jgi:hypothetical protein